MPRACFLLPLLLLASCSSPDSGPYPQNPAVSDAQGHPRDSATSYFSAADSLHDVYSPKDSETHDRQIILGVIPCAAGLRGASYTLSYFDAPVLSNYYLGADITRFLWLRALHRPVLLTLRSDSAGVTLHTQLLDKTPGFQTLTVQHPDSLPLTASTEDRNYARENYNERLADPEFQRQVAEGKRRARLVKAEETTIAVSPQQWQHFQRLLRASRFQQLPACQPRPGLLDGAYWLLEVHTANGYHMVARQNPEVDDPFRQACAYLIELSSVRGEERY